MNEIMKIDTIQQYNDYFGVETLHPLVSVIEGSRGETPVLLPEII